MCEAFCAVSRIRQEFPSDDGIYVNFDRDDIGPEIERAWEFR